MRVKWTELGNLPEEYWETDMDYSILSTNYAGEVIGTVRSWGTTRLVVMLDCGRTREVDASVVERD